MEKKYTKTILLVLISIFALAIAVKVVPTITGYQTIVGTELETDNVAPVVESVEIDQGAASVTLIAEQNKTVTCVAIISDANGWGDINQSATFARIYYDYFTEDTIPGYNVNYGLLNDSGSFEQINTTTGNATFEFKLPYHAAQGRWNCYVYTEDNSGLNDSGTDDINVLDLVSFEVGLNLNFGSTVPGTPTTTQSHEVTNFGNTMMNLMLNGTEMDCTTAGTIPVGNVRYDKFDLDFEEKIILSGTEDEFFFRFGKKTQEDWATLSLRDTLWQVNPPQGVKGTCTGTIQFTAIDGEYEFSVDPMLNRPNVAYAKYTQDPQTNMYYEISLDFSENIAFKNSTDGETWDSIILTNNKKSASRVIVLNNGNLATFIGNETDLYMYSSTDKGISWSNTSISLIGNISSVESVIDIEGNVHISYSNATSGNSYYINSTDNGDSWSVPTVVTAGHYSSITVDLDGKLFVITSSKFQGEGNITLLSSVDGENWDLISNLPLRSYSDSVIESVDTHPYIVLDLDDTIWVAFTFNQRTYTIKSYDAGATWDVPRRAIPRLIVESIPTISIMNDGSIWLSHITNVEQYGVHVFLGN